MIRKATLSDSDAVKYITVKTISEVYPHYYPKGAVDFFLKHHSDDKIVNDIMLDRVFVCFDSEQSMIGTVTIKDNEICRLFVLPDFQGNGYGLELIDYAEKVISDTYSEIVLAASLPAKRLYLKRGYEETEYHIIRTENDDYLCYDVMVKRFQ